MVRKLLVTALLALVVLTSCASAEVVGRFEIFNMSEEKAAELMPALSSVDVYVGVDMSSLKVKYYDSLTRMLLALERGEVDSITVPRHLGLYILENNTNFVLKGFNWWFRTVEATLNFGCLPKNAELIKKIDEALMEMDNDGTLAILEKKYIDRFDTVDLVPVQFSKFDDAPSFTVALTGDLPPIDYIAADGTPAGYNTAILAELGRRLHMNIKTINVEAGARLAALTSGRADAAFWFISAILRKSDDNNMFGKVVFEREAVIERLGEEVIFSLPYYFYHEHYFIGKK